MNEFEALSDLIKLLETGVCFHSTDDFRVLGTEFDKFETRHGYYDGECSDWVHYCRYFVDSWLDAANHEWQYHEPVKKQDWVPLAREIMQAVKERRSFSVPVVEGVCLVDK